MDIIVQLNLGEFNFFMGRMRSVDLSSVLDAEAETYLSLMQDRYVAQSRGGWMPLKETTNRQRQRLGFPPVQPILVRDGHMFGALNRGAPGNVFEMVGPDVLRVGIGGQAVHPGYGQGGQHPTIGQIAFWHQNGTEKLPIREILVPPDGAGINAMRIDGAQAMQRIVDATADSAKATGASWAPGIAAAP